ncbi:MAG: ABC transporter permease subunit [Verrucomicrobiales bacterium]
MKRSRLPLITLLLVLGFFYLPVGYFVANSFNASAFGTTWEGFTWHWYARLWEKRELWVACQNSLVVAAWAAGTSMVLGTLSAFALHRWAKSRLQRAHRALVMTPLVVPDILMGMSLLALFVSLGAELGLATISVAHITFCLSYVALVVLARLQDFDFTLLDAARDLGAGRWTAARRVFLPLLAPGILAGGLLAFTLSIDDFVITFFVSGPGSGTLPVRVYSMMKRSRDLPVINALSTLLLALTFLIVFASQYLTNRNPSAAQKP